MGSNVVATILVVDDNPSGRYATSRVLRAAGFGVLEAATGNEGLAMTSGADLVVLDVNLPDISGFEVCRKIRSTTETTRLPVIHLSATFVKDSDKVEGLDAGADGYLTHPVEPQVLVATVKAFLRTRRAEDQMRHSEAKFKAIFEQALSGILLMSRELLYLEANPAICRILGRRRDEIVGRHASAFAPAGHEKDTALIARELELHGGWRGTFPLIRADGTHVDLDWSMSLHTVPGVRLAIVTDITERKAYEAERERLLAAERAAREEAERANRLKDEFLATLSHELRTPLNAIVGWSQILKDGSATPEDLADGIDAIDRNARAQSQLISDLLDVSRITSGKMRLEVSQIDPAATVREALETVLPAIHAKQIQLEMDLSSEVCSISADAHRLQQVVWNLVTNAVKFTPRGGRITVKLRHDPSFVRLTITDSGQGIDPAFLPFVFERFRQADATSTRTHGGLGLGLSIVRHLVEMHGGTVAAESAGVGKGSEFTILLPCMAQRPEVPAIEVEPEFVAPVLQALPATSLAGVRVLVVDDDTDARALLRRVLIKSGAEVFDVSNVNEALSAVAAFTPHLLVSDIGMPEQDGYELIRQIRAGGLLGHHLPAIALTAFASAEDRRRAAQMGFQTHLSKPISVQMLLSTIRTLLDQSDPKQSLPIQG